MQQLGRYELIKRIATGGMADIYLARLKALAGFEKFFVIKKLQEQFLHDQEFVEMFLQEANLHASLHHPNIVEVYDMDQQGDDYFMVMEYIEGQTFSRLLKTLRAAGRMLDPMVAAWIGARAAQGLHHAHTRRDLDGNPLNIVHRDISPQNILISYSGEVKLIDFGIAKSAKSHLVTEAGTLKGKFSYMAPEQARGEPVTARSDIYSLGVVLHQAISGLQPFENLNEVQILHAVVNESMPSMRQAVPGLDQGLETAVEKALAKRPENRHRSAEEFHKRLDRAIQRAGADVDAEVLSSTMHDVFADEIQARRAMIVQHARESREQAGTQEEAQADGQPTRQSSRRSLPQAEAVDPPPAPPRKSLPEAATVSRSSSSKKKALAGATATPVEPIRRQSMPDLAAAPDTPPEAAPAPLAGDSVPSAKSAPRPRPAPAPLPAPVESAPAPPGGIVPHVIVLGVALLVLAGVLAWAFLREGDHEVPPMAGPPAVQPAPAAAPEPVPPPPVEPAPPPAPEPVKEPPPPGAAPSAPKPEEQPAAPKEPEAAATPPPQMALKEPALREPEAKPAIKPEAAADRPAPAPKPGPGESSPGESGPRGKAPPAAAEKPAPSPGPGESILDFESGKPGAAAKPVAAASKANGTVTISATIEGSLEIDNKSYSLPLLGQSLPPGDYTARFTNRKLGADVKKRFTVVEGKDVQVEFNIGSGKLFVDSNPWAKVKLDGLEIGLTPVLNYEVAEGRHTIELTNPEIGKTKSVVVPVKSGETVKVRESLE